MVKVSVIMSIYSEPIEWIEKSIDSILDQTFTDFEFIIINDDPNRDESLVMLNKYARNNQNIKLIFNEKNIGLTKSLNKGLQIAKGTYIARMDADDVALSSRFKKQVDFLNNNLEYVVCGSRSIKIDEKDNEIGIMNVPLKNEEILSQLIIGNPMSHPTLMIRRNILKNKNILYDEELVYSQDYNLIGDLKEYGKLFNIKEVLLLYRVSQTQITSKHSKAQQSNANKIRTRIINRVLVNENIHIEINNSLFGSNVNSMLQKFRKNKKVNSNIILKNINVSLILNSESKINIKEYLFTLFSNETSFMNKLRLIKYLIR